MIDHLRFPLVPYRQTAGECMPASLGMAVYPFVQLPVHQFVVEASSRTKPDGLSGYDFLMELLKSDLPAYSAANRAVRVNRRSSIDGLDEVLRAEEATSIVCVKFVLGREPHSVCFASEDGRYVLRDSSAQADYVGTGADGVGTSVIDLVDAIPGVDRAMEAMVFRKALPRSGTCDEVSSY